MLAKIRSLIVWSLVFAMAGGLVCGCATTENTATEQADVDAYRQMSALGEQREALEAKILQQKQKIRELVGEHGAGYLGSRLEIQTQRVAALSQELVSIEAGRMKLEAEIDVLNGIPNKTVDQENRIKQAQIELKTAQVYEARMRDMMVREDAEAVELGRKQLSLGELKEQLQASEKEHEEITMRIMELEARQVESKKKWPW